MKMERKSNNHWTTFCFFSMGFWICLPALTIAWVATEDILSGTKWTTGVVLIAYSVPDIVCKFLSPPIVRRIPYLYSMVVLTVLLCGSLLIIVLMEHVGLRLLGVAVLGLAYSFGNVVCLSMLSYYENAVVLGSCVQYGANAAALFGSFVYGGATSSTWICVAPRTAVALLLPFTLMPIFFYALLNKETMFSYCKGNAVKHQDIKYNVLKDHEPKTRTSVLFKLFKMWPFASFGFIGNFSMQLSMTAVLTTLTFPNSPFPPRDHYQYYRIVNEFGHVLGGAMPVLLPFLCPQSNERFKFQKLLILTCLNVGCLILYLFASWFSFLPNVYILLGLVCVHGIIQGFLSVDSVGQSSSVFTDAEDKAIAMVVVSGGLSVGRLAAGFLGLFVERCLKDHCTNDLLLGRFCLARRLSIRGWTSPEKC